MPSKAVTDRSKGARAVKAVADHQTGPLATALEERLVGAEEVNIGALLTALLRTLDAAAGAMASADETHEAELADDPAARDARDAAASELSTTLVALREALSGVYQPRAARLVLPGETPREATRLAAFAQEVANNLRTTALPAPRVELASIDVTAQATQIESKKAVLDSAVEAVAREEREAQTTLSSKNAAIDEYDRVFTAVAKMLEGAFTLARMDDFARRVRPSSRRPGRPDEEEGNEGTE